MRTASDLLRKLSALSHRLTRPRRVVIEALAAAPGPVSVRELHEAAGTDVIDLVTVYRTLRWLVELGVAQEVVTGSGAGRYELAMDGVHTHHLHCDGCGAVAAVAECGVDGGMLERLERGHGWRVRRHTLTFHGFCPACALTMGAAAMDALPERARVADY